MFRVDIQEKLVGPKLIITVRTSRWTLGKKKRNTSVRSMWNELDRQLSNVRWMSKVAQVGKEFVVAEH